MWGMVALAILFNPLKPIRLDKDAWIVADVGAAMALGLSLAVLKGSKPAPKAG